MRPLLALSTAIDLLNEKIGYICNWLVLFACVVRANAMIHTPSATLPTAGWTAVVHVRHPRDVRCFLYLQAQ